MERIHQHITIGLPCAQHLIEAVGREIAHEVVHLLRCNAIGEHVARHLAHAETGQRSVAIEGDVFWLEQSHLGFPWPLLCGCRVLQSWHGCPDKKQSLAWLRWHFMPLFRAPAAVSMRPLSVASLLGIPQGMQQDRPSPLAARVEIGAGHSRRKNR